MPQPNSYVALLLFLRRHPAGAKFKPAEQEEHGFIWLLNTTNELEYKDGFFIKTQPASLTKVSQTFIEAE